MRSTAGGLASFNDVAVPSAQGGLLTKQTNLTLRDNSPNLLMHPEMIQNQLWGNDYVTLKRLDG